MHIVALLSTFKNVDIQETMHQLLILAEFVNEMLFHYFLFKKKKSLCKCLVSKSTELLSELDMKPNGK